MALYLEGQFFIRMYMDFDKRCNRWIILTLVLALATGGLILWLFIPEQSQSVQTLYAVAGAMVAFLGILFGSAVEGTRRMNRWLDEDPVRGAPPQLFVELDKLIDTLDRFNEAMQRHHQNRYKS